MLAGMYGSSSDGSVMRKGLQSHCFASMLLAHIFQNLYKQKGTINDSCGIDYKSSPDNMELMALG